MKCVNCFQDIEETEEGFVTVGLCDSGCEETHCINCPMNHEDKHIPEGCE